MIRGLWTHAGVLYSVIDAKLVSIDSAGLKTELGTLNSGAGPVDFASNVTQLIVNDGSYLYVFTPLSNIFETVPDYPGGDRISFLDLRVNYLFRGTQKFGWSAIADATSLGGLDFASAEGSPDLLVSQVAANRELIVFGTDSTEIWDPVGGDVVYQRSSAAIDYGCAAAHSAQKTANSVIWLSRDERGQAMVLSLIGHQPKRISTRAEEEKFEGLDVSQARAYTYSYGGDSLYCLNVPGVDTTLTWSETFPGWHERGEWVNGKYQQWRPTCHAFAYGKHHFGSNDGKIWVADRDAHKFGDDVKRRERIFPVIAKPNRGRVRYPLFEVVCEKATGATVMLRKSDDDGANFDDWVYESVGKTGNYAQRARFNRMGSGIESVFDLVMTDDAPFNPVQVNIPLL